MRISGIRPRRPRASHSRPLFAAAALLSAAVLAGCTGGPELPTGTDITTTGVSDGEPAQPAAPQPGDATDTPAPPQPTTATATPRAASPTSPTPTTDPDRADSCEAGGITLVNTDFGAHTALNRIPVSGEDGTFYSFTVAENRFDPCAELSWIVLEGSLTDESGAGGTGASIGDAVVFFHGDTLVTEPRPLMTRSVESVQRVDEDTVRVLHGHLGGTSAEGVTDTFPTTHVWNGTALDSDTSQLPAEVRQNPTLLNVAAPPMAPSAAEGAVAQTLVAGRYQLPINESQNLLCDVGHAGGPVADCYADFPTTWKMVNNNRPQATRIIFTDAPPHARTTADATPTGSGAEAYGEVQGGARLAVGEATVDLTQPDQATISTPLGGIRITPDSYEVLAEERD